jgi:excisionase family DNA binding protein
MNRKVRNAKQEVQVSVDELEYVFDDELLTTEEVANWLRVPVATVRQWRANRDGPRGHRVGRHIRYRRSDVEAWLAKRADRIHGGAAA